MQNPSKLDEKIHQQPSEQQRNSGTLLKQGDLHRRSPSGQFHTLSEPFTVYSGEVHKERLLHSVPAGAPVFSEVLRASF